MTTKKNLWLIIAFIIILVLVGYIVSQKKSVVSVETQTEEKSETIFESEQPEENVSSAEEMNGRYIGYITDFSLGRQGSLTIDYIQFLNCSDCPNDYEIKNENPRLRTFFVSPNATVRMQTYSHDSSGSFAWDQIITQVEFETAIKEKGWGTRPYWITLQGGVIVDISEQYLP